MEQHYKDWKDVPKYLRKYILIPIEYYEALLQKNLEDRQNSLTKLKDETLDTKTKEWFELKYKLSFETEETIRMWMDDETTTKEKDEGLVHINWKKYHLYQADKCEGEIEVLEKMESRPELEEKIRLELQKQRNFKNFHMKKIYGTRAEAKNKMTQQLPVRKLGQETSK